MFLENYKKSGSVELICGSMFSGKTEELIRRMRRAQFANQKIAIFKPAIDVRYSDQLVVSHDAHKIESFPISDPKKMLEMSDGIQVIGIDEAQFFDHSIVEVVQTLANRGIRVIVAGLDTDFLGKPFGPMPARMAVAEEVTKVLLIGVTTFLISVAGVKLGSVFGTKYQKKAEIAGGVILILLGLKILLEHLGVLTF